MMTTMEIVAYVFFIALLGGSFIIGAWLSSAEKKKLRSKGLIK